MVNVVELDSLFSNTNPVGLATLQRANCLPTGAELAVIVTTVPAVAVGTEEDPSTMVTE